MCPALVVLLVKLERLQVDFACIEPEAEPYPAQRRNIGQWRQYAH